MRNGDPGQKKLKDLLERIGAVPPPALPESDDPLAVLILSFLTWESTTAKAVAAFKRIREGVVDFNDLRVCLSDETQEIIGPRYPRGLERCQRLRAVLRNIYHREHAVTLDRLEALSKRDIRRYLLSLEGIVPLGQRRRWHLADLLEQVLELLLAGVAVPHASDSCGLEPACGGSDLRASVMAL